MKYHINTGLRAEVISNLEHSDPRELHWDNATSHYGLSIKPLKELLDDLRGLRDGSLVHLIFLTPKNERPQMITGRFEGVYLGFIRVSSMEGMSMLVDVQNHFLSVQVLYAQPDNHQD